MIDARLVFKTRSMIGAFAAGSVTEPALLAIPFSSARHSVRLVL